MNIEKISKKFSEQFLIEVHNSKKIIELILQENKNFKNISTDDLAESIYNEYVNKKVKKILLNIKNKEHLYGAAIEFVTLNLEYEEYLTSENFIKCFSNKKGIS